MKVFVACLFIVLGPPASAQEKVALLIGNSAYEAAGVLENPVNDVRSVAISLENHGFDVTVAIDQGFAQLNTTLRAFRDKADQADVAMFYYAGHGIEVGGQNFLVPTDARLEDERDAAVEAITVDAVLRQLSGAKRLKIVVLDACRNNPFGAQMKRAGRGRSVGRGLARAQTSEPDTLIAYAAAAGEITPDGTPGGNSPFTAAFLKALKGPPMDVRRLFGSVRDIMKESLPGAEPFVYTSLGGTEHVIQLQPSKPIKLPSSSKTTDTQSAEVSFWESIRSSETPADYDDYLSRFPDGTFRPLAMRRLAALKNEPQKPVNEPSGPLQSNNQIAATTMPTKERDRKVIVRETQQELNRLGCGSGKPDGVSGNRTEQAVKIFAAVTQINRFDLQIGSEILLQLLKRETRPVCTSRWFVTNASHVLERRWNVAIYCPKFSRGNRNYYTSWTFRKDSDGTLRAAVTFQGRRVTLAANVTGENLRINSISEQDIETVTARSSSTKKTLVGSSNKGRCVETYTLMF